MYVFWLLCVCWCAGAMAVRPTPYSLDQVSTLFNAFKTKYGKKYTAAEAVDRLQVFIRNLAKINRLNQDNPNSVFGINVFMDLTPQELNTMYKGFHPKTSDASPDNGLPECNMLTDKDISATGAPEAYDWVKQGAVTSVKNQAGCRSCWAFSSTGHLEGRNYMKHKKLVNLSQQQLVDCNTLSSGCGGGTMVAAFRTLIDIGGSMTAEEYPYVSKTETCKTDEKKAVVKLTRCFAYNLTSQQKVKELLHEIGPISIAVRSDGLYFYQSGIVSDKTCSEGGVDHAVLLVGYGTDENGDYWLVKNSYGDGWGENGYFRMQRGENCTSCGMMNTYMSSADIE